MADRSIDLKKVDLWKKKTQADSASTIGVRIDKEGQF